MSQDKDITKGFDLMTKPEVSGEPVINEPKYPILRIEELPGGPNTPDQRDLLPHSVSKYLTPELKVIDVKNHEHVWPRRHFSAEEVIMMASKARHINEIGYHGPSYSSISLEDGHRSRYETVHGRDLEQASEDMKITGNLQLAKTSLVYLAERQGVQDEIYEPGKPFGQEKVGGIILVELDERDPVAQKFERRLGWKPEYYGSADAPVNYINLAADIERREPGFLSNTFYESKREEDNPEQELVVAFDRALQWVKTTADEHQGLIAYKNPVKGGGIRNQGWRDSDTAMVHKDGQWASDEFGIAPIEIQGFLFDAYMNASRIKANVHKVQSEADELRERAWDLQKFIINKGFVNTKDGGFFASGFDWAPNGSLRPLEVATSAMARLLTTDILKSDNPDVQEMVRLTIKKLMSPEMITRWGWRTLAADELGYIPSLYHRGPIWEHDSNEGAKGLANHQYYGLYRVVSATTTHQHQTTGVFYEHISGSDNDVPEVPNRDTYVYDQLHDVVYLFEQAPPPGQTWAATTEIAKHHLLANLPLHAIDKSKFEFEKQVWKQLPPHIHSVVSLYEPELAIALAA